MQRLPLPVFIKGSCKYCAAIARNRLNQLKSILAFLKYIPVSDTGSRRHWREKPLPMTNAIRVVPVPVAILVGRACVTRTPVREEECPMWFKSFLVASALAVGLVLSSLVAPSPASAATAARVLTTDKLLATTAARGKITEVRHRRRHWRHRRWRRRRWRHRRGPRFYFYWGPPYYYGYYPYRYRYRKYRGRCAYWHRRCRRRWGHGANFRGCMRYHGCW